MADDTPANPWATLEAFPGLSALPGVWEAALGDQFEAFKILCLEESPKLAASIPCPRRCGCLHTIIHRHDGTGAIAICRCEPPGCPDIPVSISEITPLQVNRSRLARALAKALSCQPRILSLRVPETMQFGSWSSDQVPMILTIQSDPHVFRSVITELATRLRRPFILLAPTADQLNAECQELVATAQAGFFPIDSTLRLTEQGILLPLQAPGELFARFTPRPKEFDEDVATRVVALVSQFDSETLAVFRLYCLEGLSAAQVARSSQCSKATVLRRLEVIRAKTGIDPQNLRRLSPHLERIENDLADSRAAHIHRKRLIHDDSDLEGATE